MFSDELAVTIHALDEEDSTSVFVPSDLVRRLNPAQAEGQVKVRTYMQDSTWWAILPTEYGLPVPVKNSDLPSDCASGKARSNTRPRTRAEFQRGR
jgi:hypothetical protein